MSGLVAVAYSLLAVALGALFWLAWTRRHDAWAAAFVALVLFGGMAIWSQGQGRAKPCHWEIWRQKEAPMIAAHWEEGRAIWVWIDLGKPFYCEFPWSKRQAEQLAKATKQARADRGQVMLRLDRKEGEYMAYIKPPPPLPEKRGD